MSQRKNKIKAFTLTEVMVTMAISSLVVIMSYSVYRMLNVYFNRVQDSNSLHSERLSFRLMMAGDVHCADSILFKDNILSLYCDRNEIQWYQKGEHSLVRKAGEEKEFIIGEHQILTFRHPRLRYICDVNVIFSPETGHPLPFQFRKHYLPSNFINP